MSFFMIAKKNQENKLEFLKMRCLHGSKDWGERIEQDGILYGPLGVVVQEYYRRKAQEEGYTIYALSIKNCQATLHPLNSVELEAVKELPRVSGPRGGTKGRFLLGLDRNPAGFTNGLRLIYPDSKKKPSPDRHRNPEMWMALFQNTPEFAIETQQMPIRGVVAKEEKPSSLRPG